MSDTRRPVEAPSALFTALENRAVFELGAFMAASPLLRVVGRGDRHPVLVLPGFTASDSSTVPLRWALRSQGYWVHGWNLGRNLGPTRRVVDGLIDRLEELHGRHGRPVSIVGWSLGGIYARELARLRPDSVRQVITLGSPFRTRPGDRSAVAALWDSRQKRFSAGFVAEALSHSGEALSVPSTAIYTRTDGIVKWHLCIESDGPRRESIEVRGSHSGLGFNPAVILAISDRLGQREGTWKPFHPPLPVRAWYPRPESYRAA
jgi:pimeloyl-ACP methyl ester carboxylesterase